MQLSVNGVVYGRMGFERTFTSFCILQFWKNWILYKQRIFVILLKQNKMDRRPRKYKNKSHRRYKFISFINLKYMPYCIHLFKKHIYVQQRLCFTAVQANILLLASGHQMFLLSLVASRTIQSTKSPLLWVSHWFCTAL